MAKDYYHIDPDDPPSIKKIVRSWAEEDKKAYDSDSPFHLYLPVELLYKAREVNRAQHEMRAMDDEEWENTKKSLRKKKWLPESPAILAVGKDGCIYLAGGNHRATLAHKIGLERAPVRLIFRQRACDSQRGISSYSPSHSPEALADELTEDSDNSEYKDQIPGGLADLCKPKDFNPKQVKMGTKVEMEHTDDPKKALEIALDHLKEDPKYYTKLKKIEPKHYNEGVIQEAVSDLGLPSIAEEAFKKYIPGDSPPDRKARMFLAKFFKRYKLDDKSVKKEIAESLDIIHVSYTHLTLPTKA